MRHRKETLVKCPDCNIDPEIIEIPPVTIVRCPNCGAAKEASDLSAPNGGRVAAIKAWNEWKPKPWR